MKLKMELRRPCWDFLWLQAFRIPFKSVPLPDAEGCLFSLLGDHGVISPSSSHWARQLQYVPEARADGVEGGGRSCVFPMGSAPLPHCPNSEIIS